MKVKWKSLHGCLWLVIQIAFSQELTCTSTDSCSCTLSDGHGKIDLKKLNETVSNRVKLPVFWFSPCHSISVVNSSGNCSNVNLCMQDKNEHYRCLGASKPEFHVEERNGVRSLFLKYVTNNGAHTFSRVYLQCSPDVPDAILTGNMVNTSFYNLTLHSQHCCPLKAQDTLSTGSILLIVFFTTVTSYFVVGVLYNKTVYAASGTALIPHYQFWSDLPGLIKDGYLFFISPCLGDSVEYKYYQRL
ncbi:uncharacterized protein LOC106161693 [Lingula anatina]|uniref:Uncharacterized protein LOC106161693 n=1 Tax=Lingula anatina TaxID=7574 RepID=A0A1S3I8H7_LINAN|nr:uncharacterized protein LOC106161693 [Lingula anatina]|eukprot:XP_013394166.1 uncharacterized protein LOC106161693 [Lingula anatina]